VVISIDHGATFTLAFNILKQAVGEIWICRRIAVINFDDLGGSDLPKAKEPNPASDGVAGNRLRNVRPLLKRKANTRVSQNREIRDDQKRKMSLYDEAIVV
jgi:hypothetical protein